MASEYNIQMIQNGLKHHYDGGWGIGASLSESDDGRELTLRKGDCFPDWISDPMVVKLKSGAKKPISEANRTYLHYVIDCWLDGVPVTLSESELP